MSPSLTRGSPRAIALTLRKRRALKLVFGIVVMRVFHQRVLGGCDAQDGFLRWFLQLAADEQLVEDMVGLVCAIIK
jgi:hypothetical protein